MLGKITNGTDLLKRAADISLARQEVIAHNASNVDTPRYKRKDIVFKDYLLKGKSDIKIVEDNSALSNRLDGNNVDIEREMAEMAKNSLRYNVLIQTIAGRINNIKSVINEGRR